jgi:hypothetical protein
MGKSKRLVLVYKNMPPVNVDELVDIVLTPQNYIVKREKLPITSEYKAKKIAPSIFGNLLEEKERYSFFVYKDRDSWVFIAYIQDEIIDLLKSVGIASKNINRVFFIQQFYEYINQPIALASEYLLVKLDNIVTVVPKKVLGNEIEYLDFDTINKRPKKSIVITNQFILDSKIVLVLSLVFFLFGLSFVIEGYNISSYVPKNQDKIALILERNPSLVSSYSRDSILSKYRKIDAKERKKRDLIIKLSKVVTSNQVEVDKFTMDDNSFELIVNILNSNTNIEKRAVANGFKVKKLSNGKLKIEGRL